MPPRAGASRTRWGLPASTDQAGQGSDLEPGRPASATGSDRAVLTVPISTVTSPEPSVPRETTAARRVPASVSMATAGPETMPASMTARAKQRRPLPLVSARPPSALRSSIRTSPPETGSRSTRRPSAPIPKWRSQSARRGPRRDRGQTVTPRAPRPRRRAPRRPSRRGSRSRGRGV